MFYLISFSETEVPGKIQSIPTLGMDRKMLENAVQNVSSTNAVKEELTNCIYLQDSKTEVFGLKIYGTPWQPKFCGWAFNLDRGHALMEKWDQIPDDTDILITHTPPVGYGDLCSTGIRAGCVELLMSVQQRIKPKYHIYGHIHEGIFVISLAWRRSAIYIIFKLHFIDIYILFSLLVHFRHVSVFRLWSSFGRQNSICQCIYL